MKAASQFFGPFESLRKRNSAECAVVLWMLKMCCEKYIGGGYHRCVQSQHCLTLSYFYSLALYLVYVRALRIACEHFNLSHTNIHTHILKSLKLYSVHSITVFYVLLYVSHAFALWSFWFLSFDLFFFSFQGANTRTHTYRSHSVFHLNVVNNSKELQSS